MGVAPSQCAIMKDIQFGIAAGVAAGMTAIGFLYSRRNAACKTPELASSLTA
jgi:beta-phosphoglucomutase-like phosphatase (HAD superfamily)